MTLRSSTLNISPAMPPEKVALYTELYNDPVGYRALKGTESIPQDWHDLKPEIRNQLENKLVTVQEIIAMDARIKEQEKRNAA